MIHARINPSKTEPKDSGSLLDISIMRVLGESNRQENCAASAVEKGTSLL